MSVIRVSVPSFDAVLTFRHRYNSVQEAKNALSEAAREWQDQRCEESRRVHQLFENTLRIKYEISRIRNRAPSLFLYEIQSRCEELYFRNSQLQNEIEKVCMSWLCRYDAWAIGYNGIDRLVVLGPEEVVIGPRLIGWAGTSLVVRRPPIEHVRVNSRYL